VGDRRRGAEEDAAEEEEDDPDFQELPKPVVLTGSQKPIVEVRTDARQNLISRGVATRGVYLGQVVDVEHEN
jgi:hypothetical protein